MKTKRKIMTLTLPGNDPIRQILHEKDWKYQLTLDELNEIFTPLSPAERIEALYTFFDEAKVLYTSSFGTKSVFLLHLISQVRPSQKVHFIDTTFHFPETLAYRDRLAREFGFELVNVTPHPGMNEVARSEKLWTTDRDLCCSVHKVLPLEPIKAEHDVWISGLMGYQTPERAGTRVFEEKNGIVKFHPIIDVAEGDHLYYMGKNKLPQHPLEAQGYGSIGCEHCTRPGKGREGRWSGDAKKECGLHV